MSKIYKKQPLDIVVSGITLRYSIGLELVLIGNIMIRPGIVFYRSILI